MGPDSLIELIGHARVQPDGTYTWQNDGWTSDVGLLIVSLSSRYTRYRYDNVALWHVMTSRDFYIVRLQRVSRQAI